MRFPAFIPTFLLALRLLAEDEPVYPGSEPAPTAAPAVATNATPRTTPAAVRTPVNPPGVPGDAFALRRFELIPPFPTPPRFIPAVFPRDLRVESVERLGFGAGRLWLVARPAGAGTHFPGEGRLWTFQLAENRLEPVRGLLQTNRVRALLPGGQRVWLTLDTGLASLAVDPFVVDAYGAAQGITTPHLAGIVQLESGLQVLGRNGILFTESQGGGAFVQAPGNPAPVLEGESEPWNDLRGSRDWLLATGPQRLAARHIRGTQWVPIGADLGRHSPRLETPTFRAAAGDGEGGFWVGSDAGLHLVNPETGGVESRFAVPGIAVPGGLGMQVAPGFKVTPAGIATARARVANGIRDRMRQRARAARLSSELHAAINTVLPTSRLPGGVTAVHAERTMLWIATTDGANTNRGRVLLFHMPSRRWLGWFPVGSPVRSLLANDRLLWLGLDITRAPGATPLVAIDKFPLMALPQFRWTPDALPPEDLGSRLAALPPHERALYAFFGGEPAKVVELLAPEGTAPPEADAETLFLLAFAHDAVGLDQPAKLDTYLTALRQRHPDSVFTEIAKMVRPAPVAAAIPPGSPALAESAAPASSAPTTAAGAAELLVRRDLDGDGRLNATEFKLWRGPDADLKPWDKNGDGFLDLLEVQALLQATGGK